MKELKKITIGMDPDFMIAVNEDIQILNKLIKEYNDSSASSAEKKQILITIYEYYQSTINKYPGDRIAVSSEFGNAFFEQMFQELQHEFKIHGLNSLNLTRISEYEIQAANANSDRTIQENFEKLLRDEAEGIKFFFSVPTQNNAQSYNILYGLMSLIPMPAAMELFLGVPPQNNNQNYNTKLHDHIRRIPKEGNPEQMYQALKQLRFMVYEDIAKLNSSSSSKNNLRVLIQAINSKLDQLEKTHPELITRVRVDVKTDSFPDFIANMAPDKVKKMTEILAQVSVNSGTQVNKHYLKALYSKTEEGGRLFHELLNNHQITFLGGTNSKNFKLTHADGSEWVLKVENRLNAPKEIEVDLATSVLSDTLTRIYADRQTAFTLAGNSYNRGLLVLEYCPSGDLESHSALQQNTPSRIKSALSIYSQMGTILEAIRTKDAAFSDMKNSNWLIDATGKVRISDSKSFQPSTNGFISFTDARHKWYGFVNSREMNPPEFEGATPNSIFNTDRMHAYMLGKNLYQYLSGCDFRYLIGMHDGLNYDFSRPEFQTSEGKVLKELIVSLIKPNPDDRISVAEAIHTLDQLVEKAKLRAKISDECMQEIGKICAFDLSWNVNYKQAYLDGIQYAQEQEDAFVIKQIHDELAAVRLFMEENHAHLVTDCYRLLDQFSQCTIGTNDTLMQAYISRQREKVNETKDINSLNDLTTHLSMTLESLQLSHEINTGINYLRNQQSHWYSATADKIENAMNQIAVEERNQILSRDEPRFVAVRVALETFLQQGNVAKEASTYKNSRHQFFTPLVEKKKDEAVDVEHRPNNPRLK